MTRKVSVSVPATSANLGPGFDSMAAALGLRLVVTVEEAASFHFEADIDVPLGRSNLLVRAFETVLSADGWAFSVKSGIPLCGGLGSSACAVLGGLLAARALGGRCPDPLAAAIELDGVADNANAAWCGGIAIHADGETVRLDPPTSVRPVLVIPSEPVDTAAARAVLPKEVPMVDAVRNAGHAAILGAGLATDDPDLITKGLHDSLHQSRRSGLYPRSLDLVEGCGSVRGAVGATISGAGSAVLVWARPSEVDQTVEDLGRRVDGWAQVIETRFDGEGALVNGEPVQ